MYPDSLCMCITMVWVIIIIVYMCSLLKESMSLFGCKGCGEGNFTKPYAVCVDRDGLCMLVITWQFKCFST